MLKKFLVPVLVAGALGCSCTRKVYVPVESTTVRTDSVHDVRLATDSVMLRDSVFLFIKGDTVVREAWHTQTRLKVRTDTLYRQKTDTVVREVPVPVPGEPKKSAVSSLLSGVGNTLAIIALIAITLLLTFKFFRKR